MEQSSTQITRNTRILMISAAILSLFRKATALFIIFAKAPVEYAWRQCSKTAVRGSK